MRIEWIVHLGGCMLSMFKKTIPGSGSYANRYLCVYNERIKLVY